MARVGDVVVESVGPDWHPGQGRRDGGVIHEELIRHHLELLVAANSEEGRSDSDDGAVGDVGEPLRDQSGSGHLGQPVVVAALAPVVGVVLVGHGEHGDLVALPVELLDGGVVGVPVGHEESALDLTAVWILSLAIEQFLIEINVVRVDGSIEGDGDHLRNLVRVDISRDSRPVWRTETVGKLTFGQVAVRSSVGILAKLTVVMWRNFYQAARYLPCPHHRRSRLSRPDSPLVHHRTEPWPDTARYRTGARRQDRRARQS